MYKYFLPLKKQGAIPEVNQANCRSILLHKVDFVNIEDKENEN